MILYTWVGDDGLVRWSDELPNADWLVRDTSAGVVGPEVAHKFHAGGYDCLMRTGHCVSPIPRLEMALALAYWDDV